MTSRGGYTKTTLIRLGVLSEDDSWPPPRGWKKALLNGPPLTERDAEHSSAVKQFSTKRNENNRRT